ncbi:hypothetical protein V9T40_013955 [Parthenolecanium corni]|uniref:CWF19-like protein 1 n=1 Tax=Parthenolecanium corni TaxID=536013 RepID=A0AAN9TC34_9HEMI
MTNEPLKILVCGDVEGKFSKLFSKIKNVDKKSGPFDYLFCVGNFFGTDDKEFEPYKSGKMKVPVPTYILGPNDSNAVKFYPEVNGCELAPDITYLGKRGLFTTNSGLTIAYVSGIEDSSVSSECQITPEDIERTRNACVKTQQAAYRGTDILLTSTWPENVTKFDNNSIDSCPKGSALISKLALLVQPRYHFFGLAKKFYERRPYKNEATGFGSHITRAIALANADNDTKQKWLFALNLTPLIRMKDTSLNQLTTDTTECPYTAEVEKSQQFFYDMDYEKTSSKGTKRKQKNQDFQQKLQKVMNISQSECWFCLASPKFEKQLVISIGEEAYLSLPKGGLVWDHAMILPVTHYRHQSEMPSSLIEEIEQYPFALRREALRQYYSAHGKKPIFYDRNYKTPHYQIQAIPVPSQKLATVERLFMELAEEKGFSLTKVPESADRKDIFCSENSYFYVEIGKNKFIHHIKKFFPLQFAREVLAHPQILNVMDRVEWRNMEVSKEDETNSAERFRDGFKAFDFTV